MQKPHEWSIAMSSNTPTVIELAHNDPVIEAGLRYILGAWPEFELRSATDLDCPDRVRSAPADVFILDHESGVLRAASLQADCRQSAKLMVVAMRGQELEVRSALEAGIRGYVLVGCSADEIVSAARAVASGRRYLCSAATLRMVDSLSRPALTVREGEVLALVRRGHNNKEVARSLGISVGTVKAHMRGLLSKLGARCRTEALWIASQQGLAPRPSHAASARPSVAARMPATDMNKFQGALECSRATV
jgi:DNA-binding NarL/FixJ family response regulator